MRGLINWRIATCLAMLIIAGVFAGRATAADAPLTPEQVDGAVKAATAYHFGDSRQSLLDLERVIARASAEPALKTHAAAKLAAVLATDASPDAKQYVCRMLGWVGTSAEVPALAALLADEKLTDTARQALERIGGDDARGALMAAMKTTTGRARLGVITSLGVLGGDQAIESLSSLAAGADADAAAAAITALGAIGSASASQALLAVEAKVPPALKSRLDEALLRCGQKMLADGRAAEAASLGSRLSAAEHAAGIRRAAFLLRIQAMGERGGEVVIAALSGDDAVMRGAAIRAMQASASLRWLGGAAEKLDTLSPAVQLQLIALLGKQGKADFVAPVTRALGSKDAAVSRAAIMALASMGDASAVRPLAEAAANADADTLKEIERTLVRLRGKNVDDALATALKTAAPAAQVPIIRAIVTRGCASAVPSLAAAVRSSAQDVRRAAIAALAEIAPAEACQDLVALLDSVEASERDALITALGGICRRTGKVDAVVSAMASAPGEKKIWLLGVFAAAGGPQSLDAIRAELKREGVDATLRLAAVRLLADWADAGPLDDLAAVAAAAANAKDTRLKILSLRGVAKLAPQASGRPAAQVVEIIARAMAIADLAEQKALLASLGKMSSVAAMKLAAASLEKSDLADEAGLAVVQIVQSLGNADSPDGKAALAQVKSSCKNPAVLERINGMAMPTSGLRNLSIGATATNPDGLAADGQAGGPQAAIDGNPKTYWDETDHQKLYILHVALKNRAMVRQLRIMGFQQHMFAPKDFEVLCDGAVVKKVEGATYNKNWLTVDLPATVCTAVELRITGYYGGSPAIRELEIMGAAIGDDK